MNEKTKTRKGETKFHPHSFLSINHLKTLSVVATLFVPAHVFFFKYFKTKQK